jgi:hypothetical protein
VAEACALHLDIVDEGADDITGLHRTGAKHARDGAT